MTAEYTVGAVWVQLLTDALSAVGFDTKAYCQRMGWNLDRLRDTHTRLPWKDIIALWGAAARSSGDPHLGLHAAASLPFRVQSPFGYLMASSPTLREGLALMIRYQDLHFDGQALSLDDRGDHFALGVSLPEGVPKTPHQVEYICALLKRTCAFVVGPAFRLVKVRFRHGGPASGAEYERIFECPVEFRQSEDALILPRETISLPSLYANSEVLEAVQPVAERLLAELGRTAWTVRVRMALQPDLSVAGHVDEVAAKLGVSRRSLQRRLAAEHSSFARVLDQTRQDKSLDLIQRRRITVAAIASQVGFADARAFARAFQRWTGLSPSAFRSSLKGQ